MKETQRLEKKNSTLKCNTQKQKNENWYVEELSSIFYYNYFYNNWLEMKTNQALGSCEI